MKRMIIPMAALLIIAFCFDVNADDINSTDNSTNNTMSGLSGNLTILSADSVTNLTENNTELYVLPAVAVAQAVKFTPPRPGWKLMHIIIYGSDGWNQSTMGPAAPLPFIINILDGQTLEMLYHYSDTQLAFFNNPAGLVEMADIEIPPLSVEGPFFVCFYGYGKIGVSAELQNSTGNSYYITKAPNRQLFGAGITHNGQTVPVNWLIRAEGF